MVVVDTSVWVEWLLGSSVGRGFASTLADPANCIVPTIVQLELAKWVTREMPLSEFEPAIAYTSQCLVVSLDTRLALLAADIGAEHKLATADAIIYATARSFDADLLTCDAHFKDIPHVVYVAKGGAAGQRE